MSVNTLSEKIILRSTRITHILGLVGALLALACFIRLAIVYQVEPGQYTSGLAVLNVDAGNNLAYHILSIFEEVLEMAGIIAFIRVLIIYVSEIYTGINFHFDPD